MKPASFSFAQPASIREALTLLADGDGEAKPIAGGQSLVPMMAFRLAKPATLVDITRLPGMARIVVDETGVSLGALVRWRDIEHDERLATAHPLLCEAISHVAHYQIRNRGTVGGSCAHADPAAEMPGIAVACDAQIVVESLRGRRIVPAADFFLGALTTALAPDELIVEVRLPPWPTGRPFAFEEFARRRGDFAIVAVAAFFDRDADGICRSPHVGVLGAGDRPQRLGAAEAALADRPIDAAAIAAAAAAAGDEIEPNDDPQYSGAYRRALTRVLVQRALARAADVQMQDAR
jgi:carbon-monoxide dehydrogenase medium subunit